jgi:hypothetical protein
MQAHLRRKLGSPLRHLHGDWGLGSPLRHLHRDWAHPCHICNGTTGGSPLARVAGPWAHAGHPRGAGRSPRSWRGRSAATRYCRVAPRAAPLRRSVIVRNRRNESVRRTAAAPERSAHAHARAQTRTARSRARRCGHSSQVVKDYPGMWTPDEAWNVHRQQGGAPFTRAATGSAAHAFAECVPCVVRDSTPTGDALHCAGRAEWHSSMSTHRELEVAPRHSAASTASSLGARRRCGRCQKRLHSAAE